MLLVYPYYSFACDSRSGPAGGEDPDVTTGATITRQPQCSTVMISLGYQEYVRNSYLR